MGVDTGQEFYKGSQRASECVVTWCNVSETGPNEEGRGVWPRNAHAPVGPHILLVAAQFN